MRDLSENNIQSELSYAYLHAVAAKAKMSCKVGNRHDDNNGVDAQVSAIGPFPNGGYLKDFIINIQLKSTRVIPTETENHFSYPLDLKGYNDLRETNLGQARFLVVLYLSEDSEDWLNISEDQLILKKCAYWVSLRNAPASSNSTNQTVYIPKSNLLTPQALIDIAATLSHNIKIDYTQP